MCFRKQQKQILLQLVGVGRTNPNIFDHLGQQLKVSSHLREFVSVLHTQPLPLQHLQLHTRRNLVAVLVGRLARLAAVGAPETPPAIATLLLSFVSLKSVPETRENSFILGGIAHVFRLVHSVCGYKLCRV